MIFDHTVVSCIATVTGYSVKRRSFIVAAVGGAVVLGGCSDQTQSSTTATDPLIVSGDGEYPHEIHIDNSASGSVTMTLVARRGGETIYEEEHTVAAEARTVVAGVTKQTLAEDPLVTFSATDPQRRTATREIRVSDCLGHIYCSYHRQGPDWTYDVC
jgi:hypothetical protein